MSKSILIIGEPGSGKSCSIRTLDHSSTYIINAIGKDLPFKKSSEFYKQQQGGNLLNTDDSNKIIKCLMHISQERPDIKTIIIDDFQYILSNDFMRRTHEKDWDKFNAIATAGFTIVELTKKLRDDIIVIIIAHSHRNEMGFIRSKQLSESVENKLSLDGRFTIVLEAFVQDGKYLFKTNNDGNSTCRTPPEMFEDKLIPNDLQYVINKIKEY